MGLMGVLAEIGIMRCSAVVLLLVWARGAAGACPSLCSCRGNRSDGAEPAAGEPLRLRCGGSPTQITELKEIDLSGIWSNVVSLNMSGNAISTLSRELHLPNLQKLDLSRNQINLIESDAFYNITSLQRLDLSYNQISTIYKEMFKGLTNLERLVLAHNLISVLAVGTFDHLVALKQLDITENQWICDCDLLWVGDWLRNTSIRLVGNPKCKFPENLATKNIRKLKIFLDLSACGSVLPLNTLIVRPSHDQVVFEGDTLTLSCNAPFASVLAKYELKWVHPMLEICDVNITSTDMLEEGTAETTVFFQNITNHHMGNWTCMYADQNHVRHNYTVKVLVLSNKTQYCLTNHTVDNKGLYSWPQLLLNHTAVVPCRNGEGTASRICHANATWGPANTTECSYISNVTKLLQQFALLNVSLVQYSALNATDRLAMLIREKTYPLAEIEDPDDVMFIAQAIKNYMQYMDEEKDLGSSLLDVISATMNITPAVMARAESQHGACTQITRAAEQIAHTGGNKQKPNLAVESFPVREGWGGVTCVWYDGGGGGARRLHCTTTNRTVAPLLALDDALIHASVQIPQSLLYSTAGAGAGAVAGAGAGAGELVVALYADGALFPLLPAAAAPRGHRAKDYYGRSTRRQLSAELASPVVGFQLRNGSASGELLEPVIATVRARGGRCAVWSPRHNRWQHNTTDCKISHAVNDMVIISCTRLAYVGVLQHVEPGIYGARSAGARFKVSHPAVYVGSLVLLGCLGCLALTYVACWPGVLMPRAARHALLNTWLAMAALCFLYTLGIYQTEDVRLCRALGLLIHYLTLACLLWMCVSAHDLYARATRARGPPRAPDDEPDAGREPVLGLYLAGWGIALIVCGISGAVNLRDYAGYAQCFLSAAPALGAVFVPGALLLLLLLALFLLTRCALRDLSARLSEGTQATEHAESEAWAPGAAAGRRSARSADSEADDAEHAPAVRLRAHAVALALFLCAWACAAVAVYRPLPAYLPYQEDICSVAYSVCATVLGTFLLFFYGIARSDVRAQWAAMPRYLRRSERCCRNRSVFDSNHRGLAANPAAPPAPNLTRSDGRSRSASRCSNGTNSKTNNSGTYRAAAELDGRAPQKNADGESPNINLVVLHRRQYRSNNSMVSFPDGAGVGPEAFYNPNQMNVAKKFFKRQRQSVKRNRLELPARRDFDVDSHASLPLPARAAYCGVADIINSGTKVNNTNLHVDESSGGIKETRRARDPNLLDEESHHKSYSTDRKSWSEAEPKPSRLMNIYTNVPETRVPRHQVVKAAAKSFDARRGSVSEECLRSRPETRTVSQQCSLEYSSASDAALPHTCSDQTLNTHSELTSLQETHSALCSTNEITDTESFGQYIDYLQPKTERELDKSLQDISEECTARSDDAHRASTPRITEPGETGRLLADPAPEKHARDSETCSTNASEQGFENESDIYCPNYQASEVSIRSHGLYAPPAVCAEGFDEDRYANWHRGSPESRELDELYTRIREPALDASGSDATLRPGSGVSEALSEDARAETAV